MPPNLRSAVAQCWRSIGSRRNFSSSSGSNGEKRSLYPSFETFPYAWATTGYAIYGVIALYNFIEVYRKFEREHEIQDQLLDKKIAEFSNR